MDPIANSFSYQTTFAYAGNSPVVNIDYLGLGPSTSIWSNDIMNEKREEGMERLAISREQGKIKQKEEKETKPNDGKIDLKNIEDESKFVEKLISSSIEVYKEKGREASLFDIVEDNNYSNAGSRKWGNMRRFEKKVNYGDFVYDLFVIGKNDDIKGQNYNIYGIKFTRDLNQELDHTRGSGSKQRPGFVVFGLNGNSNLRRLISITTIQQDPAVYIQKMIKILSEK